MIDFNAMSAPGGICKDIPPFAFGASTDIPLVGDWTGKGYDSIGTYRPSTGTFYLKNSNTSGNADIVYTFGMPGATPIVFHGENRVDHVGVVKDGTFYLRWSHSPGVADNTFAFGSPGDTPIMGDWTGMGTQTAGIFRSGVFYLIYKNELRNADKSFSFGTAGDVPLVGDWTARKIETVGLFRNGTFFFSNTNMTNPLTKSFAFGQAGDIPLVGNWDGTTGDSVGVFRGGVFYLLSGIGCTPFVCESGKSTCDGTTRKDCINNTWRTVPNDTLMCGYVPPVCTPGAVSCDTDKTYKLCGANGQWGAPEPKSSKCGWECDDGKCNMTTHVRTPCIDHKWQTEIPNSTLCAYDPLWDTPDEHGCYPNRSRDEYKTHYCESRDACIYEGGSCPTCITGNTKCTGNVYEQCLNGSWLSGLTVGKCGYDCTVDKCDMITHTLTPCNSDNKYGAAVPNSAKCGYVEPDIITPGLTCKDTCKSPNVCIGEKCSTLEEYCLANCKLPNKCYGQACVTPEEYCGYTCKSPNTCIAGECTAPLNSPDPIARITASPTSGTAPLAVKFTNGSTGASSFSLDYGDRSAVGTSLDHTYTIEGTYIAKITASNGVKTSTATITITVSKGQFDPETPPIPLHQCETFKCNEFTFVKTPCKPNNTWGTPITNSPDCGYVAPYLPDTGDDNEDSNKMLLYGAAAVAGVGLLLLILNKSKSP